MERLLREAQREGSTPPTSREPSNPGSHINSPPRPQSLCASSRVSPIVSGNNSPSRKTPITPLCDVLPELPGPDADATWIWDWSSKPLFKPPEESQFKRPPQPKRTPLSLRNTDAMKHNFFSWEFLQVFIPSIIVTNIVAFGLGVYIGKRMMTEAPKST
uniref:BCL2/adenovirus E1B 19 kDa protein-interacting protein 3-like n=1 Tax=Phallusia mammillata TaxID=59560 RepID=A0A6F9D7X2_9ASCI|nr:BCL2/adenovirus E1B 19 kDa protein-interacting protein 3-like [Phallusia mammillata]